MVWNASWPVKKYYAGVIIKLSGSWVSIAANDHVKFPGVAGLE